jgi:hypothetical protein
MRHPLVFLKRKTAAMPLRRNISRRRAGGNGIMKNKPPKATIKGILKTSALVPITDPAEQAKLDRRCRQAEKAMAAGRTDARKGRPRKGK